jgi:hypothetical protein
MVLVDELLAVEDYEIDSLDNDIKIQFVEKNLAYKRKTRYSLKRDSLPKLGCKVESQKSSPTNGETDSTTESTVVVRNTVNETGEEDEREGQQNMFENSKQWLEYFYPFKRKIKHEEGT